MDAEREASALSSVVAPVVQGGFVKIEHREPTVSVHLSIQMDGKPFDARFQRNSEWDGEALIFTDRIPTPNGEMTIVLRCAATDAIAARTSPTPMTPEVEDDTSAPSSEERGSVALPTREPCAVLNVDGMSAQAILHADLPLTHNHSARMRRRCSRDDDMAHALT